MLTLCQPQDIVSLAPPLPPMGRRYRHPTPVEIKIHILDRLAQDTEAQWRQGKDAIPIRVLAIIRDGIAAAVAEQRRAAGQ